MDEIRIIIGTRLLSTAWLIWACVLAINLVVKVKDPDTIKTTRDMTNITLFALVFITVVFLLDN